MTEQQVLAQIQQWIIANGNNEITADVLRPILEAMLAQPNDLIGDLQSLGTNSKTDLVTAINELINSSGLGIEVHVGTGTVQDTPPLSYSALDFYVQDTGTVQGVWQYNGVKWIKLVDRTNSRVVRLDLGQVSTSGMTTTRSEIVAHINATGFAVFENELIILEMIVREDGVFGTVASYFFGRNDVTGTWGTGSDNGSITSAQLILNNWNTNVGVLLSKGEVIEVGDIGVNEIHAWINSHTEPVAGEWTLDAGTIYFFRYTKEGNVYTDIYVGQQPAELGTGGNYVVTAVDFETVAVDGRGGIYAYINQEDISTLNEAKNYTDIEVGKIVGDKNYVHEQLTAATVWNIPHNLNKYPSVRVKDSAGSELIGDTDWTDLNNITITFNTAITGEATLN